MLNNIGKFFKDNNSKEIENNKSENNSLQIQLLEENLFVYLQILDQSDNLLMLCDTTTENNICYMNKKAKDTFQEYDSKFKELFSNFNSKTLENNSIHKFHHDAQKVKNILQNIPQLPHSSIIRLGEITFQTKVFPIFSKSNPNKPIYYLASWKNITSDLNLEKMNNHILERKNFLESKIVEIKSLLEQLNNQIILQIESTFRSIENIERIVQIAINAEKYVSSTLAEMKKIVYHVNNSSISITKLTEDSNKITEFTNYIEDIGERSNLLAINASLEAARAGSVGKGFAIVAKEVNKLSEKTTEATNHIKSVVKKISNQINVTYNSIETCKSHSDFVEKNSDHTNSELTKIVENITPITNTLNQIVKDLQEQSILSGKIEEALIQLSD